MIKAGAAGLAVALAIHHVSKFASDAHTFTPSPGIASREDRLRVLKLAPGDFFDKSNEYVVNKDGLYIHIRRWIPFVGAHPTPKALVVLVHGVGEYCARFDHVARAFNQIGLVVYGLDHQGHGHSEGDRLFVKSFQDYIDDVNLLTALARKEYPKLKVFMMGHSLGGLIAINTLAQAKPGEFVGAVISAPAVSIDASQVTPTTLFLVQHLSSVLPKLPIDKLKLDSLCRNQAVVDWYVNDPLVPKDMINARLANEILKYIDLAQSQGASKLTLPVLLVHGTDDHLVDIAGTEKFFAGLVNVKDKTFVRLQGAMHEALHEKPEYVTRVRDWLAARL